MNAGTSGIASRFEFSWCFLLLGINLRIRVLFPDAGFKVLVLEKGSVSVCFPVGFRYRIPGARVVVGGLPHFLAWSAA